MSEAEINEELIPENSPEMLLHEEMIQDMVRKMQVGEIIYFMPLDGSTVPSNYRFPWKYFRVIKLVDEVLYPEYEAFPHFLRTAVLVPLNDEESGKINPQGLKNGYQLDNYCLLVLEDGRHVFQDDFFQEQQFAKKKPKRNVKIEVTE